MSIKHLSSYCLCMYWNSDLRIELTYQFFKNFHFREIFMFYCPCSLFGYCPIIRIDLWVILWKKWRFFLNFISYHIFALYVGGASLGLPTACRLIAVSGTRLPSVDGLVVRSIKCTTMLDLPSRYVCNSFQTCLRYIRVYQHIEALPLCFTYKKLRWSLGMG